MKQGFSKIVIIYFLVTVYLCSATHQQTKTSKPFIPPKEKDLLEGDCDNAPVQDLVFHDHIVKPALPLMVRNATAACHGDYMIYCIIATSNKNLPDSEIVVSEGGVNHTFVTLEMLSKRNEGLDYNIQVFAKKL